MEDNNPRNAKELAIGPREKRRGLGRGQVSHVQVPDFDAGLGSRDLDLP